MLDFFMDNFYVSNDILNTPLREIDFTVMDFETTGLYPYNGDRIIEVGMIRATSEKIIKSFESLINPRRIISEQVSKINNITNDMIKDAPFIEDKIDEIISFMQNTVIVAQNVNFDVSFINYQLQSMGRPKLDNWMVDTIKLAKELMPELERYSLENLTKVFKIKNKASHRALGDTEATTKLLHALIRKLPADAALSSLLAFKIY